MKGREELSEYYMLAEMTGAQRVEGGEHLWKGTCM